MTSPTDETLSEQYRRTRNRSAVADISHREMLVLSGKDHLKFLQSMISNDVLKPVPGEGIYAFMLNNKGRILTDMRLFKKDSETHLDLEANMAEETARRMNDFKLSYRLEIKRRENRALFHLTGPEVPKAVSQLLRTDAEAMKQFDHFESSIADAHVCMARVDRTGQVGFDIETAPENSRKVLSAFAEKGTVPVGREIFDIMRIESGIPEYGKDMDESVIAPETGLLCAVSFDKGCYVGQEIVARAHWRGRVNRHFSRFVFKGEKPPPQGEKIACGERSGIGRITSSGFSPAAGAVAVGYIRREFTSPGTEIKTENGFEGKVAELPPGALRLADEAANRRRS